VHVVLLSLGIQCETSTTLPLTRLLKRNCRGLGKGAGTVSINAHVTERPGQVRRIGITYGISFADERMHQQCEGFA
jgi:hypothetical protein